MKKLFLIFILLIPIAYADLILSPIGFDGTVYQGVTTKAQLQLTNSYAYTIYNINFSSIPYTTIPFINSIESNKSEYINISILTNEVFSKRTYNSVVRHYYYSVINIDPKVHYVNISSSFSPSTITINIGDSIQFFNNGSLTAVIQDDSNSYFSNVVLQNQSVTINSFSKADTIPYHNINDLTMMGIIIVQNASSELVTNPDQNKIFTLSFDSKYINSELGLELYPDDETTIRYNEQQELNVRVWNKGNETIHNVTLKTDDYQSWFSFEENNFQLTPNQNKFIDLNIYPKINQSSETNKTYFVDILATATNANQVSAELRMYVPYESSVWDYVNMSKEELVAQLKALQTLLNSINWSTENRVEYVYLNSTIEFTKEDAYKNFQQLNIKTQQADDNIVKLTKSLNDLIGVVTAHQTILSGLTSLTNESNILSKDAKKESYNNLVTVLLWIFFIILGAGGTWGVIHLIKRKQADLSQRMH